MAKQIHPLFAPGEKFGLSFPHPEAAAPLRHHQESIRHTEILHDQAGECRYHARTEDHSYI